MRLGRRVGFDQLRETFLGFLARIEIIDHASVFAVEDTKHALTSRLPARRRIPGQETGRRGDVVQGRERGRVLALAAW